MKITLTPMGGLGAIRRPPRLLDTAQLPEAVSDRLRNLVAAAKTAARPSDAPGRVRDGMSYRIKVEDDAQTFEMTQSDGSMSAEFEDLLALIQENTRRK